MTSDDAGARNSQNAAATHSLGRECDGDYYLDEGRLVFTERYHLKRGYCCHSGCRHCPFRQGDAAAAESVDNRRDSRSDLI